MKIQYHVDKNLPLVPILSHMNRVHNLSSYSFKFHFINIILHLQLGHPNGFIPSGFLTKTLHVSLLSHAHHMASQILIIITSDKEQYYESPHYAVFSIYLLLCSAYVPASSSTPYSQTPSCIYFKIWSDSLHGTVSILKFIINKTCRSDSPKVLRIITKLPHILTTIYGTKDGLITCSVHICLWSTVNCFELNVCYHRAQPVLWLTSFHGHHVDNTVDRVVLNVPGPLKTVH